MEEIGEGDEIMENAIEFVKRWNKESAKDGLNNILEERSYYERLEGREEGQEEEKRKVAKNLIKLNIPITKIIKATGLSKKDILKLKNRA